MERYRELVALLPIRHEMALSWFFERVGQECFWPGSISTPDGQTYLATRAKGIYKPEWSQYALSIRESLDSPYPDREPIVRNDGTWFYPYFQENLDPLVRDSKYTNRALVNCWRDKVPVGVFRQKTGKPSPRYLILGAALVSGWEGGYYFLEGFSLDGYARSRGPSGQIEMITALEEAKGVPFNPLSIEDSRKRTIASIVRRRGQVEFRRKLLDAYGSRCAISDCDVIEVLEAAHIIPYMGPESDSISNGLLLRADLHTLFDLGHIAIDSGAMAVIISPLLRYSTYGNIAARQVRLPADRSKHPSMGALEYHRNWSGL